MAAIDCNDINFESQALLSDIPVLVDFWAPWCGPCRAMSPIIDQIAEEHLGRLKVLKVNIDHAPQAASRYRVASIPSLLFMDQGQVRATWRGLRPKQTLQAALERHLRSP